MHGEVDLLSAFDAIENSHALAVQQIYMKHRSATHTIQVRHHTQDSASILRHSGVVLRIYPQRLTIAIYHTQHRQWCEVQHIDA